MCTKENLSHSANGLVESADGAKIISYRIRHAHFTLHLMVARMYTLVAASNLGRKRRQFG
jgi:hypothetical protein